ncbi:MAG: AraC family transcriptional regulator [Alphaproteobacteria bacterium]|nr:AraC family transcriptional regulator [Alphaproteobacteria bacterium]
MEVLAQARIVMWEGVGLWVVDAKPTDVRDTKRTDLHAHHAIQVTMGLGGRFMLGTADESVRADAVAVAADVQHEFEAEGLVAFVFIEPESRLGRAAAHKLLGDKKLAAIPAEFLGDFSARIAANFRATKRDDAALVAIGRDLVAAFASDAKADAPDLRVRKVIAWAGQQLDRPVSLADAASVGDLSASRLRHLFVEQTGLPFKTYLLWLRLTRALEAFAGGASLTEAAHGSGFADSAHLSRTFRRMFGVAPSALRMS